MIDYPKVPIAERGGRLYPEGTVYYSRQNQGFLAAGRESEGFLPLSAISGRVSYASGSTGIMRMRDETGVFLPTSSFLASTTLTFGHGTLSIQDTKAIGDPTGLRPGGDSQWVERFTLLMPDGKVKVVEVNHGIGKAYDETKQGKQWWRKMKEALGEDGKKIGSGEMKPFIQSSEVIKRTNLGPLGQGE